MRNTIRRNNIKWRLIIGNLVAVLFIFICINIAYASIEIPSCINDIISSCFLKRFNREPSFVSSYGGIIFPVTITMIISIQTISITIFVFLKSLLDRKTDDKPYAKKTLDIYNFQMSVFLIFLTVLSLFLLAYGFVFYNGNHIAYYKNSEIMFGWLIPLLIFLIISFYFWCRCIMNDFYWKQIINAEKSNIKAHLEELVNKHFSGEIESIENEPITSNSYLFIFFKIEEFLLSGADSQYDIFKNNQERITNFLKRAGGFHTCLDEVEKLDLQADDNFHLISEKRSLFSSHKDEIICFYQFLEDYRDLIALEQTFHTYNERNTDEIPEAIRHALYIFKCIILNGYIRNIILSKMSYEAATFNFSNLYCVKISESIFTGIFLLQSVVARMQIENSNLNMGRFLAICFSNTKFINVSMINAKFESCHIQNAKFENVKLGNSTFDNCLIDHTSFSESDLSDSEFVGGSLCQANFGGAILRNISFRSDIKIVNCNFSRAEISNWNFEQNTEQTIELSNQNFEYANMDKLVLTDRIAASNVYSDASMCECEITNMEMQNSVFVKTNFMMTRFQNVDFSSSIFNHANLHRAQVYDVQFKLCDLQQAAITSAAIKNADFTEAACIETDFTQTTLRDCTFASTKSDCAVFFQNNIFNCKFTRMKGKNMTWHQCTITDCTFEDFKFSSSDLENLEFFNCTFKNIVFMDLDARDINFNDCTFENVSWVNCQDMYHITFKACTGIPNRLVKRLRRKSYTAREGIL